MGYMQSFQLTLKDDLGSTDMMSNFPIDVRMHREPVRHDHDLVWSTTGRGEHILPDHSMFSGLAITCYQTTRWLTSRGVIGGSELEGL